MGRMAARFITGTGQDLIFAWRGLQKRPGFSALAILTLGLGIGAVTAIFSVVYGVLLRPLPYPRPDRLVAVYEVMPSGRHARLADPNFDDFRERNRTFASMAKYAGWITSVTGLDEPARASVVAVSRDFFTVLGTSPAVGRPLTAEDARPGAQPVAFLSHAFWRTHGCGDPSALHLRVDGKEFAVAGVMPAGFEFPAKTDLWVPAELDPANPSRTSHNFSAIGRLRDGTTVEAASADLDAIARGIVAESPEKNDYLMRGAGAGPLRAALTLLLAAVGFLLLVACANVALFLLARASQRGRELAIRRALGAGHGRLVRQFVIEALLLSGLSALAGIAFAAWAVRLLVVLAPPELPRLEEVGLHWPVLLVAAGLAVAIAAALGFATAGSPARAEAARGLASALGEGARGQAGTRRGRRTSRAIAAAQLAVTFVLLAGAALLGRSLLAVLSIDPGFRTEGMLAMDVDPGAGAMAEEDQAAAAARKSQLVSRLLERLAPVPGVEQVAASSALPLDGGLPDGMFLLVHPGENPKSMEDYQELAKQPERRGTADFCLVTPGYFPALGIRIKSGRDFDTRDGLDAPHAAVISETLARTQWPGQDPLGRTLQFGNMDGYLQLLTIVGVAADIREDGPEAPPRPIVYGNLLQRPRSAFSIILRTASDSPAILSTARTLLRAEAPDAPPRFRSFDSLYAAALGSRRFNLLLVGFFALSALLLAVAGVYGVTAYGVAQRTREIGVRMALGALPSQVTGLILREESRMALAGILAGGLGAVALLRAMRSLLYGVTETDPVSLIAVAALLTLVALGACFVPVRRAARLDPLVALRDE
jgi:putative ABC transport system permease protein